MEDLEKFIPEFVSITWLQEIDQVDAFLKSRGMTRRDAVMEMFNWRTLPTAWETIRVTFLLEGLDLTNVTHTIRHRLFSFSAQSTDPVSMSSHAILENEAFLKDPELLAKSRKLCQDANDLYDLALSKGVSYYDARHYAPRAKEAKYFMSGSLKDFIMFIKVRMGVQNQPISDNVLALRVRQAILERFPFLEAQMPTKPIEHHYVNAINEKFNLNTWPPSSTHQKILDEKGIDISHIEFDHHDRKEDLVENQVGEMIKDAIINNEI
jgi:thymidylate synthase ThyX